MGWWGALFSSKKVVDTAMDTVSDIRSGIDKIWFTDEEKADMHLKASELILERVKLAVNESSIRSMTRRIIAVSVVLIVEFLTVVLAAGILLGLKKEKLDALWTLIRFWSTPLAIVLAFYLGYYGLTSLAAAIKKD